APAAAYGAANEDDRDHRQPRDGVGQVPERHHGAGDRAGRQARDGEGGGLKRMRFGRSRRERQREAGELEITAFMNLMVVLTPFLLITAVFSRVSILELNLP